ELLHPGVELARAHALGIGDHRGQHARVVVLARPQLEGELVPSLQLPGELAEVGVADPEGRSFDAVAREDLAVLGAAEGLELLQRLGSVHGRLRFDGSAARAGGTVLSWNATSLPRHGADADLRIRLRRLRARLRGPGLRVRPAALPRVR